MPHIKSILRLSVSIAAAVLLFFSAGASIRTQENQEFENSLGKIRNQITELRRLITQEDKKESSVLTQLNSIQLKKRLAQEEISLASAQLQQSNREITAIQMKIKGLKTSLAAEGDSIKKTLVALYKHGRLNSFDILFRMNSLEALISESKYLSIVAERQNTSLTSISNRLKELLSSNEQLKLKKKEAAALLLRTESRRAELTVQENNQQALISKIKEDKETHLQMLRELDQREKSLLTLIKARERSSSALPFTPSPIYEKKGRLDWPISGKIGSRFGYQKHPRFNTRTINKGIDIIPEGETLIRAVHPAVVKFASYFEGYGNLIILDHGMRYYTLYGHCSDDFIVKKGDVVKAGDPIAVVGDTGSLEGTRLYFEVRYITRPLDPLQWLKRR